jgi:hypothetical protein
MDGFMDMLTQGHQYGLTHAEMPTASSQKGGLGLTYTRENGVAELVKACIDPKIKSKQAKCGEMNALHVFQHLYSGQLMGPKKVTTVTVICDVQEAKKNIYDCPEDKLSVYRPCDPPNDVSLFLIASLP